jgi:hypothetical protein
MNGDKRVPYTALVGKHDGKLGRPKCRRETNINVFFRNIVEGFCLDSSGSGQGLVVASYECRNELPGSIKCSEFIEQLNDH